MKKLLCACLALMLLLPALPALAEGDDWQDAYYDFVMKEGYKSSGQNYQYDEDPQFALHDIDGDGVPELLAYNGAGNHAEGTTYAYTAANGSTQYAGTAGGDIYSDGLYYYDNEQYPGLVSVGGSGGYLISQYGTLQNGQLVYENVAEYGWDYRDGEMTEFNDRITADQGLYDMTQSEDGKHTISFTGNAGLDWDSFIAPWASSGNDEDDTTDDPGDNPPAEEPGSEPGPDQPSEEPDQKREVSLFLAPSATLEPGASVDVNASAPGATGIALYLSGHEIASGWGGAIAASVAYHEAAEYGKEKLTVTAIAYFSGTPVSASRTLTLLPQQEEICTHEYPFAFAEVPGSREYAPCPDNDAKHYLKSYKMQKQCKNCGELYGKQITYTLTPETSFDVSLHSITLDPKLIGNSDYCPVCRMRLYNVEKIQYLNLLKEAKALYGNPLADNREGGFVDSLIQYYKNAGLYNNEYLLIIQTLFNAEPQYRDLYLYSLMDYEIGTHEWAGIDFLFFEKEVDHFEQNLLEKKLHLYEPEEEQSDDEFLSVFFHESGHAIQNNGYDLNPFDHEAVRKSSPFSAFESRDYEELVENCLYQDVKDYIANTVDQISSFQTADRCDLAFMMAWDIENKKGTVSSISWNGIYKTPDDVFALANKIAYNSGYSYRESSESDWQYCMDLYEALFGYQFSAVIELTDNDKERVKNNLIQSLIEDKTWQDRSESHATETYIPESIKDDPVTVLYYRMLQFHFIAEASEYYGSICPQGQMDDVFGGITNNKLFGTRGHNIENNKHYWYESNGATTHNQLYEAFAEFFSSKLCAGGSADASFVNNGNEHFFPLATSAMDTYLVPTMLSYYKDKYD